MIIFTVRQDKMNKEAILEGLLFVVGDDGLTIDQIKAILNIDEQEVNDLINKLKERYCQGNHGLQIQYLGNTYKFTTKDEHRPYYQKLIETEESNSLSQAALETLAIIAYNEPVTRISVNEIRGIDSGQMVRKLVAKGLVEEIGRSDLPGRPILYKTTNEFLDYFGLSTASDLPVIKPEEKEIDEEIYLYQSQYKEE